LLTVVAAAAEWGGGTDSTVVDAVVVAFCRTSSSLRLTVISVTDDEAATPSAISDFVVAGCSGDR
jgi:hypothetical protein